MRTLCRTTERLALPILWNGQLSPNPQNLCGKPTCFTPVTSHVRVYMIIQCFIIGARDETQLTMVDAQK